MPELDEWESFYVIVGAAAGALIGLQFVAGPAFSTPTVLHFSAALFLSALLRAPWHNVTHVALLCGALGLCGVIYILYVLRRMRRQSAYKLDAEDWAFHIILPMIAYLL